MTAVASGVEVGTGQLASSCGMGDVPPDVTSARYAIHMDTILPTSCLVGDVSSCNSLTVATYSSVQIAVSSITQRSATDRRLTLDTKLHP